MKDYWYKIMLLTGCTVCNIQVWPIKMYQPPQTVSIIIMRRFLVSELQVIHIKQFPLVSKEKYSCVCVAPSRGKAVNLVKDYGLNVGVSGSR